MRRLQTKGRRGCQVWGLEGTGALETGQEGHVVGLRPLPEGQLSHYGLRQSHLQGSLKPRLLPPSPAPWIQTQ